jgi:hypothetical protein
MVQGTIFAHFNAPQGYRYEIDKPILPLHVYNKVTIAQLISEFLHYLYSQNNFMRKLLPALSVLFIVSSCGRWEPKVMPDPKVVLPSNTWELVEHTSVPFSGASRDCRLPKYMVYREDGTGYFYYDNLCDSPKMDTLKFKWSYDYQYYRLKYQFTSGPVVGYMTAENQLITADYDWVALTCRTIEYSYYTGTKRLIDGNYRPILNQ